MAFVNDALEMLIGKQCEKFRKPSVDFELIASTLNAQGTIFLN